MPTQRRLPDGDVFARLTELERQYNELRDEHIKLMEAIAKWAGELNRAGALIIADAEIRADVGIIFPATQAASSDANTLDDYEEGSTTPTPTAGSGTLTTATAAVRYTKIGDRICYTATVTITTNGTGASYIVVPMPFSAAETTGASGVNAGSGAALSGFVSGANLRIYDYDATYPGSDGAVLVMSGSFRV
jgi:hypothetical protein